MSKVLLALIAASLALALQAQGSDNATCTVDITDKFKDCNEYIEDESIPVAEPLNHAIATGNFTNLGEIVLAVCSGFNQASACLDVHSTQCPSDYTPFFQTYVSAYKICGANEITKYFKDFFECNHKAEIITLMNNATAEVELDRLQNLTASTPKELMEMNCQFLRKTREKVPDSLLKEKCGDDDQQSLTKLYGLLMEAFECNAAPGKRNVFTGYILQICVAVVLSISVWKF